MKDQKEYDLNSPVNITDNIWWVGRYLKDDIFQCHTYLIKSGRNSVLIDPGSKLTIEETLKKIEKVIPFDNIRYFIVHHQDPDVAGALNIIDEKVVRSDAVILSHWRAISLLKHMDLKMPFQCVEKMEWTLKEEDLDLSFVFTPYLHFPGAFCTLDHNSGTLFTSDLFGAFTEEFSLFAKDESYLEQMRPFHEHYMPSREILAFSMEKIGKLRLNWIMPQHGSIIGKELIPFLVESMKNFDCGLFLMSLSDTNIDKLSRLNRFLNNFLETLISVRNFDTVIRQLLKHIVSIIPAETISFLYKEEDRNWKYLTESSRYQHINLPSESWLIQVCSSYFEDGNEEVRLFFEDLHRLALPLKNSETGNLIGFALVDLSREIEIDKETETTLIQLSHPLSIALEREIMQQQLDQEKQKYYEQSIKDSLTGFYNRAYMNEAMPRICAHHDRGLVEEIALLIFDLDHFKKVNDQFGHPVGDEVLRQTTNVISENLRVGDIAVRIGGEEFALFLILENKADAKIIGDRIRIKVGEIDFSSVMGENKQTISGGLVYRDKQETMDSLVARADNCLYRAKSEGRNRIVSSV
ncbi:diguanylate cyclase [Spirochaeta isovalerica]|uniref:diguanylate cyclase n=1 Tax=Spirochaeta isovalerica TaxID=150 RepID=A0A841R9P9_9SPIO|nr:diguanylate cyclase [Spirochaeta isovalerica]MBB6479182.1 diguanylate cyclase (GGDEF)-like protein [Spirochaeta isovalerica]